MASKRATAVTPEAIGNVRCSKPQTGAEYLESLRDGREVYIYGERVADVTKHPAFRNTARMTARLFDALHDPARRDKLLLPTDTDGKGKTHAFFKAPKIGRGIDRGPRRDRGMAADHVRLDGPLARLQGRVLGHARRQRGVLRAVRGERETLVHVLPRARAVRESRDHSSAGRPRQAAGSSRRRLRARRERDRRRHLRVGREGRRDGLRAHELHVHRASRADPAERQEVRARVHGADQRARREVPLPHVVRDDRDRDVEPVRSAALVAARRERRGVHHGQRVRAVGERVRLRRRREGEQLLPAHRASCRASSCTAARGSR